MAAVGGEVEGHVNVFIEGSVSVWLARAASGLNTRAFPVHALPKLSGAELSGAPVDGRVGIAVWGEVGSIGVHHFTNECGGELTAD